MEDLEGRILYSADLLAVLPDTAMGTASGGASAQVAIMPATPEDSRDHAALAAAGATSADTDAETSLELVFIDASVPDADELLALLQSQSTGGRTLEIHWVDSQRDGVSQIAEVLKGRSGIDALHIISHGDDQGLQLGNGRLDGTGLTAHMGELATWGGALSADADLLLYGCDLASSSEGRALVGNLALLTGADVAASDDLTGAALLGGDWELEYQVGQVDRAVSFSAQSEQSWNHVLATATFQEGVGGYTGTQDTFVRSASPDANNGGNTTISFSSSTSEQALIRFDNLFGNGAGQIPYGSIITAASLTLYATEDGTGTPRLYRILGLNWSEASTWNTLGSGVQTNGTEASASADSSVDASTPGSRTFSGLAATVQAWANGATNLGWMLNQDGNEWIIASSENGTASYRPSLSITYTPPTPPALDLDANNSSGATGRNYSVSFTEQTAVKVIDTDASVTAGTNGVSPNLSGMTVAITNPLDGVLESLAATTTGTSITASYDSGTGVLTLSGSDTAANYQTVLRTITYSNISDNPNTTSRTINFVASDPYGGNSATATTTLSVTRVNDAPVITSNGGGASGTVNVYENQTAVTTVTATDPDSGSLTYSISGGADAAKFTINTSTGVLTFITSPDFDSPGDSGGNNVYDVIVRVSDGSLADTQALAITVLNVNEVPIGTSKTVTTLEDTAYTFTVADFGFSDPSDSSANTLLNVKITTLPAAGNLTLNGVAVTGGQFVSAANIAAGLLKFTPATNVNGTGYASFTFQVQDNGGTANGGANLDVTPRTITVDVTAVNDAPVGVDKTVTTNEDTAYTFTAADFGFGDPNDSPANTFSGVRITTLPGAGSLTLNGVAVTAGQVISAANIASNLLRFTPAANANGAGYTSFTFQVQDNGGTANGGINQDATPRTMTVNVTALNDAPVGSSNTVTTLEDTAYTFTAADFGFNDPNDSPANTLSGVRITTLPATGSLTLNGVAVTAGQVVSAADIAANLLRFTPAAHANGAGNASFTFQVQDNGGTANGGVNQDATPRTMTVNVTAVNDAPAGVSTTITTLEDMAYTFTAADFGFTDSNDSPANTLAGVRITTLPASGSLTLNGVAVTAGQVISAANIASGLLKFTPAVNASGTGYASFTFQVQDNGGTANGGTDLDPTPRTMTINVTAVNDAPTGTNKTVTTLEDTAYTFTAADFGFTDPNDSPTNTLLSVRITTLPASGSLTLNGVAVTAGQVISAANIASGLLKFTPVAHASGAGYTSFTFQVQDNGGTANGGVDQDVTPRTMTVDVTAVNDAPAGTNKTVTTLEDTAYTFAAADFGFTDPNDSPTNTLLSVRITTLPASGSLTLNGVAVTAGQIISAANIASGLLQFIPAANANGAGHASFTFQVQDNGGTANGGVDLDATPRTMTVDVTAVNDAPTGTNKTVTTLEDTAYTFTASDFGFTDPNDSPANTLSGVKITTLPATGSLNLNGVAVTAGQVISSADIAAGLLRFTPAANANGTGQASFTFQVQDNGGTANGGVDLDVTPSTMTVEVTAVNDAPVGTNMTVTTNEDTVYTFTAADFGFTDPNDSPANTLSGVRITTLPATGSLRLNGVAVTASQVISAADIAAGLLQFTPAPNANGLGNASFTFQVQDNGGTANGGVNQDTTPRTMTVDVTSVNDAPVGTSKTVTTLEDTAYTFTVADFGFTDPNDSPANALAGVRITTLPASGSLRLNGVAVTAGQVISAADIAAGLLRFTPAVNANGAGSASFTFQVQDDGGTGNAGVNLDSTPRTMTVNVTAVNDAPAGTNKTVTTLEDTAYTFTAADFGFTDPNDSPANTLSGVRITTLPATGSLRLNGVSVTAGQVISAANIASGLLKFTPATNANGAGHASFTFQVQDNGGTANGGVNLDASPNTMTINVTAVNDAPVGSNNTATTLEDTAYTFTAADFGFTDPNDSPANTLSGVRITTLPTSGSLTLNGVAVTAGQVVSAANIASGLLQFTPAANANGSGYASFTFQVQDNGGTANGGVNQDATPRTMTVNVTAVNDEPSGANRTVTTVENTDIVFNTADFGFTDVSDSPANTLQAVRITTLPGAGTLLLNGVAVNAGDFVQASDIASGLLVFRPVAAASGEPYTSFTFQVQDNGGTAHGGVNLDASDNTLTVNVTSKVNQAPQGQDNAVSTAEDVAYVFTTADFGFTDANDTPSNQLLAVRITTLPGAGSLLLNGVAVNAGDFVLASDIAAGSLIFLPGGNDNGAGYASFTFQVQDDGGTANGGSNLDATPHTMTVDVTPVNDAPVGADKTVTTLEDVAYTFAAADFGFSDPNDVAADILLGVRITTLPGAGSLLLNGVAVNAGDFILASDIVAGLLVYLPPADGHGTGHASFTFQVQDDGGTANGGTDLDATPRTMTLDVTAVNDAPVGVDHTVSTLEDTAYTFDASDFGFTDPGDVPGHALQLVRITTLPGTGSLTLNGMAVVAGQLISAVDIGAGLLVYTPAADAQGNGLDSFTFQVQDDGGTANGGIDLDVTARTMTIDVGSVNDAPEGTDKTVTTNEDTAYTFAAADFGFTDSHDLPGSALAGVRITTLPTVGSLRLNGVAVTAGQMISAADIAAGLLVYTPAADDHGAGYASFTFQVQDDGGTADGGIDLDVVPRTVTVDVTAVNDAPTGANTTVTTLEDTPYTFLAADFGFSDAKDSPTDALSGVRITTLPAAGSLRLNGVAVTAGQVVSAFDIAAGLLVYTPAADDNGANHASFTFQVQDDGGTANGGLNQDLTPRTMTVDVTAVNDAPVGSDQTVATLEDTAYTFVAADFGFTDPKDSPANALAGVRITTLPASGSLRLNGVAVTAGQVISAADIASGLLQFTPAVNAHGTGHASFTFQVQDNGGTANGGVSHDLTPRTMTVDVTAVNDAPIGTSKTVTALEDTAYTFTVVDFGFTDPNDSPTNTLLGVRITTLPAAGSLRLNGVAVTAGQVISTVDIAAGLLLYTPAADNHGPGHASFTFQVQDDGGTANGGIDLDTTPSTMTVDVTAVSDAPTGASTTITTLEDTAYTFTAADFGFSDANDTPGNALQAVRITTLPLLGSLTLNGVAVDAGDFISAADIAAGLLVYTPAADDHGASHAGFTFQVQDDGGTANGGIDLDATPRTMTVDVTAVNDAPMGTDQTVMTNEDTAYTFTAADFGFTDPGDAPADTLLAVRITTLPLTGSLTLNGVTVNAGQVISAANIISGLLKYTPTADAHGMGYASFTFQVQDNGGTAHGGVDLDATPRTMTVNVNSVNDAPSGMDNTVSTLEDTAYTFTVADFGFGDANDTPGNALQAVRITTLPVTGSLRLNGVAVTPGQLISAFDIAAGLLVYSPAANDHGAGHGSFNFQVQDNGGTAHGGNDLDMSPRTMTVDVTSVNDAPVGTDNTVNTLEDTAYTFTVADFGFSDASDAPGNALQTIRITTLPVTGSLSLNGVVVTAGQLISAFDIAAGLLVYSPAGNDHGAGHISFTFQVRDDGGTANGGVDLDGTPRTMTVDVASVNDAPVGTDKVVTTNEDTAYTFTAADFGFTDPGDAPGNTLSGVRITTLPIAGSLALNGVAVTAGQVISAADIAAGRLQFTPFANAHGAGHASFTFQVQDNGGTAHGGNDLDMSPRTMTVDVTSVNDAPVGTDNTVNTLEDMPYTFTVADFGFSDASDMPGDALQGVRITTLPGNGSLRLNGVMVTAGQVISAFDIAAGLLVYSPAADAHGHTSFTFQVRDDGGTANGGINLDTTPRTMAVNVNTVNDPPTGSSSTVATQEDLAYTFTVADFGFSDASDTPGNALQAVRITTLPAAGNLQLNGVAVGAGDFISVFDIAGGLLVYQPATDAHGTGHASFTFQVQDDGGTANGGINLDATLRTVTVDIAAVNDAPTGADKVVVIAEGGTYTFGLADFGFGDFRDAPANTFWAVNIGGLSGEGALTLAGLTVNAGDFILASDIAAGKLLFTPTAGGAVQASFTFQVIDDGGTALGGANLDAVARRMSMAVTASAVPHLPGPSQPGPGAGNGGGSTSPVPDKPTPSKPADIKDDTVDEIGDKLNETTAGPAGPADSAPLPTVEGRDDSVASGQTGRAAAYSSPHHAANSALGFAFRLGVGDFNMGVPGGNMLAAIGLDAVNVPVEQGFNLSFSTVGVNSNGHATPIVQFTETDEDRRVKVENVVVQTSGAALSIGAVWWAARMSGLLASLMISTPAWRSIDPLPVMGLGHGNGPDDDDEDDDEHGDKTSAMDARAARLFGGKQGGSRELEGIG